MERPLLHRLSLAAAAFFSAIVAACSPVAEPTATVAVTATTAPQATATSGVLATATKSSGTATPGSAPTATVAVVAPTATAADTRLRPVPVVTRPAANPNAQKGGTFRWLKSQTNPGDLSTLENISHFNTAQAWDTLLNNNIYQDGKATELLPGLANDWWTDRAGTTWTFKLRQGVKFSDGKEMTCADVKFTLDTARTGRDATGKELRTSPRGALIRRVTDVRCVDGYTVEMKTDGPLPSLAASMSSTNFSILPRHVFEGNLKLLQTQLGPGTGPFILDELNQTEFIKYKRNPNYWDQPYPYVDALHHLFTGSTTAELAAFRVGRGEYMGFYAPPPGPRAEMVTQGRLIVKPGEFDHGLYYTQANWTKAPWNDKRFSLALRCAIDGEKVIKSVFNNQAVESPVFPLPEQSGASPWSAVTKDEWKALGPCYGPTGETNMDQRRQVAKDLLAQLGFGPGNPARPVVPVSQPLANQWVSILDDLKAVGIEPKEEPIPSAQARFRFANGEFDLMEITVTSGFLDPDHFLYELFYSTSDRNYGRYTNAELDALIDRQSRELDPVKRRDLIKQASMIVLKDNLSIRYAYRLTPPYNVPWVMDHHLVFPFTQTTWQQMKAVWIDQAKLKQIVG